jgi:hypothetical protein
MTLKVSNWFRLLDSIIVSSSAMPFGPLIAQNVETGFFVGMKNVTIFGIFDVLDKLDPRWTRDSNDVEDF